MNTGSILIVARNSVHLTKKAVNSALAQDVPCDVMVIDNASSDSTMMWLKTKPIAPIYYDTQKSLAACWNNGLKAYWSIGREEVLVVNNDVELRPDTYRMLSSYGGVFITGVSVDRQERIGVVGDRDLAHLSKTANGHPDFSCFMIHKHVTDVVGWFDESYYPAYGEDCQYHVRMHRAGVTALCVDLPFFHYSCGTLKSASDGEKARIERGADANRNRFRKEYGCLPGSKEYEELFR